MRSTAMRLVPLSKNHNGIAGSTRNFTSLISQSSMIAASTSAHFMDNMGRLCGGTCSGDVSLTSHPSQETRRYMSKYLSKSATKRLPLNTKRAKKGYYKGKGCTSEGRLTSKGKFIADPLKKLQLIVPDMAGFRLKPYIAKTISKIPPEDRIDMGPGQ